MRKSFGYAVVAAFVGTLTFSGTALAQRALVGNWTGTGNDPGQSGWQKAERVLTPENTPEKFKFLWKLKLGPEASNGGSFNEPLLAPRLINAQGFKDIVFSGATDTLYAVDSELGVLLWKKKYSTAAATTAACSDSGIKIAMEPPVVINFSARRAPGPRPVPEPPPEPGQRRLGGSAGGGGFTLKAIYVLAGDGMLHGQVLTTGADYGPPVKFLPAANAGASGISLSGKTVYTTAGHNCAGVANGVWALDMTSAEYPITTYKTGKVSPLGLSGPTVNDGVAYIVTGSGSSNPAEAIYANSIVAVSDKDAKAKDWYTPEGNGKLADVTPVSFTYKQKKLLAAPGPDGSFVLLDAESLGGTDHHTPLAETAKIYHPSSSAWNSLAAWEDTDGTAWVLASVTGSIDTAAGFPASNGAATHGSIVAFKVEEANGKIALTPAWISPDLINPSAPRIANGVVIALGQGSPSSPARLLVLDGKTGKELYNSGHSIATYAHDAGVSIGDSHVFFTTHDNTLYSFGIGIEH